MTKELLGLINLIEAQILHIYELIEVFIIWKRKNLIFQAV